MTNVRDLRLTGRPELHEKANAAARLRPDLVQTEEGRRALAAAWEVGPAAVLALCQNHPTPEQLSAEEKEKQRKLRFRNIKFTCACADDVEKALDGAWGDATRREIWRLIEGKQPTLKPLAAWWRTYERGERVSDVEFARVAAVAESAEVRQLMGSTDRIVQQAIAEENAKINARKARRKKP